MSSEKKKVLITGGTGFVGSYLFDYLSKNKNYDVFVSSRRNIEKAIRLDLLDIYEIRKTFMEYEFDKIFHLTSQSSVHLSFKNPFSTLYDNINTTLNLLKIIYESKLNTKVVLASTSEVYKTSEKELTEDSSFEPRNPYAISKIIVDYFSKNISKDFKMNVTLLRLFNHSGPGQIDNFVLSSFSRQLAEIKLGLREPVIKVGNLDVYRDFIDVRDVVRAYEMVSNEISYGEVYNVCSGYSYKIRELLDKLIEISGLEVKVEIDKSRVRKSDIPKFVGSYHKINNDFGWSPEIKIERTLEDMYLWWLENLRN